MQCDLNIFQSFFSPECYEHTILSDLPIAKVFLNVVFSALNTPVQITLQFPTLPYLKQNKCSVFARFAFNRVLSRDSIFLEEIPFIDHYISLSVIFVI